MHQLFPLPLSRLLRPERAQVGARARRAATWQRTRSALFGPPCASWILACSATLALSKALRVAALESARKVIARCPPPPRDAIFEGIEVRPLSPADSIPELTRLLHLAYARLAAMGLRYMATPSRMR